MALGIRVSAPTDAETTSLRIVNRPERSNMLTHTEYVVGPSGVYCAQRTGSEIGQGVFISATLNGKPVTDLRELIDFAP